MAPLSAESLDEIVHRRPDINDWWLTQGGQRMDEHVIHRYMTESPFFDWTSKNGTIFAQAKVNEEQWKLTVDRKALETHLRERPGLEYVIVGEPQPVENKALALQGMNTGIWTIRKQNRVSKKKSENLGLTPPPSVLIEPNKKNESMYWEVTVLGTYFCVGENVYQAPSVFDVIGNRITSAAASLNAYFDVAGGLPRYTPAAGHHYLPRAQKQTASNSATATPEGGSPAPGSRDESVVPDRADSQAHKSASVDGDSKQATAGQNTSNYRDTQLLNQSLDFTFLHGDEFVDENPLIGEPGNLRFATSTAAVKKRRADEEAAESKARAERESASTSRMPSPKPEKAAPTPPAVFSETKVAKAEKASKEDRRGGKPDKKRKKSRANNGGTATSPTTPASATSPQAPNSALS